MELRPNPLQSGLLSKEPKVLHFEPFFHNTILFHRIKNYIILLDLEET